MFSVPALIAALNMVIAAMCVVISIVAAKAIRSNKLETSACFQAWGLIVFCGLGWAPQRMWWGINRILEAQGWHYLESELYASLSWITILPLFFVVFGAGLLIAPLGISIYGNHWMIKYSISMLIIIGMIMIAL